MARYIGNPLTLGSFRGGAATVVMTPAERARHLYVVGATRTGKSKLLEDCIRQDVMAWPRSGCGLMLLDRHGALFDNVMKWAAALDLSSWPIVPLDLRRSDWVVSYNPLRRRGRGEEPSVVVGNFVRSILHACGQTDSNATPRLAKWLEATLGVLHHNKFTLAEALQLIVCRDVRQSMVSNLEDVVAKSIWDTAPPKEAEFQEMVESTVNRLRRFLSRQVMRAMLGQSDVSLDLSEALDQGQIILAAIATEGAKIDDEDASTIGSLLLSDLWMAAKARGKRDEGGVKPFYVYLDEFQEYVTPSMAETLDQASGFGLHMTFAHQFPSQLLKSDQGKLLYNSVLANCRSKVVFQLEHNEDLENLTLMLYRQMVDTRKVKHELYSTKVMGHHLAYLPSYGTGTNQTIGAGTSQSHTDGRSHAEGTNWSHTDGASESLTETDGTGDTLSLGYGENENSTEGENESRSLTDGTGTSESDTDSTSWGESEGRSTGGSVTEGANWNESSGRSSGRVLATAAQRSRTVTIGAPDKSSRAQLNKFVDGQLTDREEGVLKEKYGRSISIGEGESESESDSTGASSGQSSGGSRSLARSHGTSRNISRGGGHAHGVSRSENHSEGESDGTSIARARGTSRSYGVQHGTSHSESLTSGTSESDTYGGSETFTTSVADTRGTSTSRSEGASQSTIWSPMLMPIMGAELSSVTFEPIDEQLFRYAQYLAGQPDRHCVVKLVSKLPVAVMTMTVKPARTTDEWAGEWATATVGALNFAMPMDEALARIKDRQLKITAALLEPQGEPFTAGIPIDVKAPPNPLSPVGKGAAKRMRRV